MDGRGRCEQFAGVADHCVSRGPWHNPFLDGIPGRVVFWPIAAVGLILANVVLQLLDIWTTLEALSAGAREQNVVSRTIMEMFGIPVWVAIKGLVIAALVACGWWLRDGDAHSAQRLAGPMAIIAIWMTFVVAGNFQVLESL